MTNPTLNDAQNNTQGGQSAAPATGSDATKTATENAATQQQTTDKADLPAPEPAPQPAPGASPEPVKDGKKQGDETKGKDGKGEKEKPAGAPEGKYELKTAEGVKITPEVQTQFEAIARELNLPQESAQKLLDLAPELSKMQTAQLIQTANEVSNKWAEETRNDTELGGSGDETAYNTTMALVAKTRDAFATPELLSLLQRFDAKKNPNGTGLGNHPEVIRLFARIGKSISEDNKVVTSSGVPKAQAEAADKLYSTTTSKK